MSYLPLTRIWKSELSKLSPQRMCFNLLKNSNKDYIEAEDLKPLMKSTNK